jgi:hypothetical protein
MQRVGRGRQQLSYCPADLVDLVIRPSGEWDRYSSRTVSTLMPRAWAAAGEPTEAIGVQGTRSDHVHSHTSWPVGVGELANEVGQCTVGDTGPAGLRRGFGTEMAADGDDPGPLDKPVLNSADETARWTSTSRGKRSMRLRPNSVSPQCAPTTSISRPGERLMCANV